MPFDLVKTIYTPPIPSVIGYKFFTYDFDMYTESTFQKTHQKVIHPKTKKKVEMPVVAEEIGLPVNYYAGSQSMAHWYGKTIVAEGKAQDIQQFPDGYDDVDRLSHPSIAYKAITIDSGFCFFIEKAEAERARASFSKINLELFELEFQEVTCVGRYHSNYNKSYFGLARKMVLDKSRILARLGEIQDVYYEKMLNTK